MIVTIGIVAAISVAAYVATAILLGAYRKEFTVFEYQRGLRFKDGKLVETLKAGKHRRWGKGQTLTVVDVRPVTTAIGNQEILSKDGLSIKLTATARYQIVDPAAAILESQMYLSEAYHAVQIALRDAVTDLTADQVLEQRAEIGTRVTEVARGRFARIGLHLDEVELRDITFSGDLKKAMAQVALAQKEGLASLERARGEAAALRTLANAARLIDGNPALMQLRMLQSLSDAKGATLVLNTTDRSILPTVGNSS